MQTEHEAMGEIDKDSGEFWLKNPWDFEKEDFNLSYFEHNGVFLNNDLKDFLNIGFFSGGADTHADTRACAVGDLNNDGRPDLIVRSIGGGPLRVFKNTFPQKNYLKVTLRGVQSNTQGLGARLKCEAGGRKIYRDMWSENTFFSQNPSQLIFGLREDDKVDSLEIRWPSGKVQTLQDIPANQHILITEGKDSYETPWRDARNEKDLAKQAKADSPD